MSLKIKMCAIIIVVSYIHNIARLTFVDNHDIVNHVTSVGPIRTVSLGLHVDVTC